MYNMNQSFIIRKSSCHSLVKIPTFLTTNIFLRCVSEDKTDGHSESKTNAGVSLVERLADYQPIIEEEARKKKQLVEHHLMCLATVFLVCCLLMVGTMFAFTSEYQDTIVANMINVSNHHNKMEKGRS